MKKNNKTIFYLAYTLLFSLLAGLILFFFYSQGKTMINADGDGFRQHFRALVYYSDYLKKTFRNFLSGHFVFPQWDFVLGEGNDVLKTFHYYGIGDIFTFFSFLCPKKYLHFYYDCATLFRMYCAGLSLSFLCFYKEKKNFFLILAGSLLYAFCPFNFSSMTSHVFFIGAAVFLPLIILGVEKIINGDSPFVFIISVMFSSLSNIYFFYMNVVSTILYVIIRLFCLERENKEKIRILVKIAVLSALGLSLSAMVFLPMFSTLSQNTRLDSDVNSGFFFSKWQYINFLKGMTFEGGTYVGGYSIFWIPAISSLLIKKKNKTLIILLIVTLLFLNIPVLSSLYNALVYPTDRWRYAVSLLMIYIIVDSLDDFDSVNSLLPVTLSITFVYYGLCFYLDKANWKIHFLFFVLSIVAFVTIKLFKYHSLRNCVCLIAVLFGLFFQIYYDFSLTYWGLSRQGTDLVTIDNMCNDEHSVFNYVKDDSFFRYSGYKMTTNENVQGDHSSTQYYWSIVNDSVAEFRKQLAFSDKSIHHYSNYDERYSINELAGVKYYVNKPGEPIPYGFSYLDTINGYEVSVAKNYLPLVFAYDNYVTTDEWNEFSPDVKNEVLLQAAVLEEDNDLIEKKKTISERIDVPYNLSHSQGIAIDEHSIKSVGDKREIYFDCKLDKAGEYYILVEGLYSNISTSYIVTKYQNVDKYFIFKGNDNQHFTDRHDYLVNLGYFDNFDGVVSLSFPDGGSYEYDSIRIVCQPLLYQEECVDKLKDLEIKEIQIKENVVSSQISLPENKIVCFSIPYAKGWKAIVDGEETKLLNCNIQYLALPLEKGDHTIELKYSTPYLKEGTMISLLSLIALLGMMLKNRRHTETKW